MEVVLILLWLFGVLTFILALIAAFVSKLRGGSAKVFLRNAAISFVGSAAAFIGFGFVISDSTPDFTSEEDYASRMAEEEPVSFEGNTSVPEINADELTEESETPTESEVFQHALELAERYLEYTFLSKQGLYEQLLFEGYSEDASQYAVDNVKADWQENARLLAQDLLDYSGISEQGLYDRLTYSGFTEEQAEYAMDNINPDWNEEALKAALRYVEYSSLSEDEELYNQLLYEEFTPEQAQYAIDNLPE